MPERCTETLCVNGEQAAFVADLRELLARHAINEDSRGVAVAVNGEIVPKDAWMEYSLAPGDVIDIVGAVQGG